MSWTTSEKEDHSDQDLKGEDMKKSEITNMTNAQLLKTYTAII